MKRFFYVAVVAAALFVAKSCKPEPDPEPPPIVVVPPEDSSGTCTVIFKNVDEWPYKVEIDNNEVNPSMLGNSTFKKDGVRAGTRTLFVEQTQGFSAPNPPTRREITVKILTDSVYIWQFP